MHASAGVAIPGAQRQFEWPVPLPAWFWSWAQWYLDRGSNQGGPFRSDADRPRGAPREIPDWAWRRLSAMLGRGEMSRAHEFVRDRLRQRFGAREIETRETVASNRDPDWIRVSGVFDEPVHRIWAAWLEHLADGRWHVQYLEVDAAAVQPTPYDVRSAIPCDIRPAFAIPRC